MVSVYTERNKEMIRGFGAAFVGVADVEPLKATIFDKNGTL